MKSKFKYLKIFGIISFFSSLTAADVIDSLVEGAKEFSRERPIADYQVWVRIENDRKDDLRAEVQLVRINGKLLDNTGSYYKYRSQKGEPSRTIWVEVAIFGKDSKPELIRAKKELSINSASEKIIIRLHLDYKAKTVTITEV